MELKIGDCVQAEAGRVGKVVHINRLTVFVAFAVPGNADRVKAYLERQLTKVDPPKDYKSTC